MPKNSNTPTHTYATCEFRMRPLLDEVVGVRNGDASGGWCAGRQGDAIHRSNHRRRQKGISAGDIDGERHAPVTDVAGSECLQPVANRAVGRRRGLIGGAEGLVMRSMVVR